MEEEREGTAKRERDIVTGGDGDGGRGDGGGGVQGASSHHSQLKQTDRQCCF